MAANAPIYLGVEAGGTKIVCAAGAAPDRIVMRHAFATASPTESFADLLAFAERARLQFGPVSSVGVGSFGPLDIDPKSPRYGTILRTPKRGWRGADWRAGLGRLAAPVLVDTDVNAAALGEWLYGAGKGLRVIAYVTVGTGIGVGMLADGRPLNDARHPELGHMIARRASGDEFDGVCPFHGGCLEGLASGAAIARRHHAMLSDLPPDHPALDQEADYLAQLALTITLAQRPDRIIFGGGVMQTGGLIDRLRIRTAELIGGYLEGPPTKDMGSYLASPALGADAGIIGALALAKRAAKVP